MERRWNVTKQVKVGDLPTSTLNTGVSLYCRQCREHYSATRGDYFTLPADEVLECCGRPLVLARRVTMVEEVA